MHRTPFEPLLATPGFVRAGSRSADARRLRVLAIRRQWRLSASPS